MENFDVVLFSPPSRMVNHYRPPVGLIYLGGYLTRHGLKAKIIDVPLKDQIRNDKFFKNLDQILENIFLIMTDSFKKVSTKIVGISCYTPEYYEVIRLAKAIKSIDPQVTVVVGGIHPTLQPDDFFEGDTGVDICVLGEGEVTLLEIFQTLKIADKNNLKNIPGIAYFDSSSNKTVLTQPRIPVEDLNDISFPDYSLIDMDYYTNANPYAIRGCFLRSMYLLSTRGCPSQCTFCVAKKLREYGGKSRVRSAESLIEELKALKKNYAIDGFYFIDDLFTIDKKNVEKFCRLLKNEKLGLLWGCSSKVSTLNEDVLRSMADSGCVQIDFGVECGSDEALMRVKKGINLKMIKNIFSLCHKYKIRTFANMLVNLPGEKEHDLEDDLALLDQISPEVVSLNIFTPYPGTQIYEESGARFKKEEYARLSHSPVKLLAEDPGRFRFCSHSIDLGEWVRNNSRRYNKIWPNLRFYLQPRYLATFLRSKNKRNYFAQLGLLLQEFINQKF